MACQKGRRMNAYSPLSPAEQKKSDSRRKRKAILAGGVVLGLGAAVTLAAWSDDVFADGVFGTGGVFLLEGSEDAYTATNFGAAQTEGEAIRLTFTTAPDAAAITPGDTLYAPFSIRLSEDSTLDGELETVTAAATGPMADALHYTITSGATSCETDGAGNGSDWVTGQPVNGGEVTPASLNLVANDAGTAGDLVPLCVAVTFPDTPEAKNAVDSATIANDTSVAWDFFGEQN